MDSEEKETLTYLGESESVSEIAIYRQFDRYHPLRIG
jgi:hypothetical protein